MMGNFHFGNFSQTLQLVYIPKLLVGEAVLMPTQMTTEHVYKNIKNNIVL